MGNTDQVMQAVDMIRAGGVVACPTESFLGLLADARNSAAVERIVDMKGRAQGQAMALIVPNIAQAKLLVSEWTALADELAQRYWPGPLTLVLNAAQNLNPRLLDQGRIGMRVPGESLALKLAQAFGGPLTATSANLSGKPAVRNSANLDPAIARAVDLVITGEGALSIPSTFVDVTGNVPRILRPGAIELTSP